MFRVFFQIFFSRAEIEFPALKIYFLVLKIHFLGLKIHLPFRELTLSVKILIFFRLEFYKVNSFFETG